LWIEAFNTRYKENVIIINNNNSPGLDSAWISGFTDAEGCFTGSVLKRSGSYTQVQVRYVLSQKRELMLMTKLSELFGGNVSYLKSYDGHNMTVNLLKLHKVITYFAKYNLKTKKHIDYFN